MSFKNVLQNWVIKRGGEEPILISSVSLNLGLPGEVSAKGHYLSLITQ
jgi:hypothetical protein